MSQIAEQPEIKDKIIASGIRVGTVVKTKFMIPFITQSNPEGFYLLDLDLILNRIQTAGKFIKKFDITLNFYFLKQKVLLQLTNKPTFLFDTFEVLYNFLLIYL